MAAVIRDFRSSDMEDVIRIWLDASVKAHDFVDPRFWHSKVGDMEETYIPASETYVYEDEAGIKGFFSLHENTLAAMFVSPEHQGEGIGRTLMARAKQLRRELEVRVYKKNPQAVRFYGRCGFDAIGEKVDEHTGQPELVMRCRS